MSTSIRLPLLLIIIAVLSGCQTLTSKQDWPTDIPARKIFVKGYLEKRGIKRVDADVLDDHLIWIIRFYQGTLIYPNGWNSVSDMFLSTIKDGQERRRMAKRVRTLGITIANEWAQDNGFRNINSSNISVWGSALRTAAERGDQKGFIARVEDDVETLIQRKMRPQEISYERYYPAEDYDSF